MNSLELLRQEIPLLEPVPPDMQHWVEAALTDNKELKVAQFETESARHNVEISQSTRLPTLDFVASYSLSDSNGEINGESIRNTAVSFQFNYPLSTGGSTSSKIRGALAQLEASKAKLLNQYRITEQLTRGAYLNVPSAIGRVRAEQQALVSTEAGAKATQAGFKAGTRTSVDVLFALRETYLARLNLARAHYDYILNSMKLEKSVGMLNADNLIEIAQWLN